MNIVNILKAQTVELTLYDQILSKLYRCYDHMATRYNILKTDEQLQTIKMSNCYVAAQFQGVAYVLFFCIVENKNNEKRKMNILIPKKDLKDTKEKNKTNEIKMYNLYIPFVKDEYYINGTILDGKITKSISNMQKIEHCFIIHELYYNSLSEVELLDKYKIIKQDFLPKLEKLQGCKFVVSRLYLQSEMGDLFSKLETSKYKVIGLMFLFKTTKTYYVYTNEEEFDLLSKGKPLPVHKKYDNSLQEFIMRSTKITDVYQLYDIEDDANIGLAGIPDIATSHFYRNIFKTETCIKVKCIRSEKFGKWIPLVDDCYDYIVSIV